MVAYRDHVPQSPSRAEALAGQLLDAQVAHHLERLTGDRLVSTVVGLADDLLSAGGRHRIEDLVDRHAVTSIVVRVLGTAPASAAVGDFVELLAGVVHDALTGEYTLGEFVDRERVEALFDSVVGLHPVLERLGERLAEVPLVGTMASRFMTRIVGEVLQANKAVAGKVPGLGSLMSLGTSAASRVMGAADRQLEGLLGDTVDKGGAFAVRRLNRIVIETLRDPTTRAAALQAWGLLAQEQVPRSDRVSAEQISDVADALYDLAIGTLGSEPAAHLAEVVIHGFFDRFGRYSPTELLEEFELTREDVVEDLLRLAPKVIEALRASGDLERLLRAQLEPFYSSPEIGALLG